MQQTHVWNTVWNNTTLETQGWLPSFIWSEMKLGPRDLVNNQGQQLEMLQCGAFILSSSAPETDRKKVKANMLAWKYRPHDLQVKTDIISMAVSWPDLFVLQGASMADRVE